MATTNNLNTLKILFLIKGVLTLVFSLFFIFYGAFGIFMNTSSGLQSEMDKMPFNIFNLFIVIGAIGFIISVAFGVVTIMCYKYLGDRTHYTFIFVVSILNCVTGLLGILLGVFTLIEISKPEIKTLFEPSL